MVFDRQSGAIRPSMPHNEACTRDFYTIERTDRGDPYIAEYAFGEFENSFAPALAQVNETSVLPSNIQPLLGFVATQFMRTPSARAWLTKGHDFFCMSIIEQYVSDRDRFLTEAFKSIPNATPTDLEDMYKEACEVLRTGARVWEIDQTTLIQRSLDLMISIAHLLASLFWGLHTTPEDALAVTSDDPVLLAWNGLGEQPPLWQPGIGDANTAVLVSLGSRHILAGISEQRSQDRRKSLTLEQVAQFNTMVACRATRFVYSMEPNFPFEKDGTVLVGPTMWLKIDENDSRAEKNRGSFRIRWA